jgi:hypothetical protein
VERSAEKVFSAPTDFRIRSAHLLYWVVAEGLAQREVFLREMALIVMFRDPGCKLTNRTDGGEGLLNPLTETRERLRASVKAACARPEVKERSSRAQKAAWVRRRKAGSD